MNIPVEWAAWISVGTAIILVAYETMNHRRTKLDSVYARLSAAEEHIERCDKRLHEVTEENLRLLKRLVLGPTRSRSSKRILARGV